MAQLLMQGTNYVNFIGRYAWVAAGEHGLHAVVVTEQEEPQAESEIAPRCPAGEDQPPPPLSSPWGREAPAQD